ncbi:MAG: AgmX/PglI C-terminal domain-containing protein, partial [Bdellovibrionota bacterium]
KSGYAEDRAGQGLGSAQKDTGRGGTGNALTGIAGGIGTQGRGSGNTGYGTGGLGNRAGIRIVPGGDEAAISGTYDREAIRRVIMANLRVIRTCYERQLNRNPELMGKLVLSWEIGEQGRVLSTKVKSNELGNAAVAQCIMDRLKTWRFPDPPANQVVDVEAYPFFFSN